MAAILSSTIPSVIRWIHEHCSTPLKLIEREIRHNFRWKINQIKLLKFLNIPLKPETKFILTFCKIFSLIFNSNRRHSTQLDDKIEFQFCNSWLSIRLLAIIVIVDIDIGWLGGWLLSSLVSLTFSICMILLCK